MKQKINRNSPKSLKFEIEFLCTRQKVPNIRRIWFPNLNLSIWWRLSKPTFKMAAAACWHAEKRFDSFWARNLIMSNWTKDQLFALNYGTPFRVPSDRIGCKDFFCKVYQKLRQTTFAYSSQNENTSSKRGLYYKYIVLNTLYLLFRKH